MIMKLNFFINSLGGGGAEKVLVDLVNQLPKDKFEITVTTLLHGVHDNKLASHIQHKCIINTTNRFLSAILMRVYCKILTLRIFARLFLKGNHDVIISYLEGFNTRVLAEYNGRAKRVAFVHCNTGVHNDWINSYSSLNDCLNQYKTFNRVCFVSTDALEGFQKVVGHLDNACVVHNVIDFRAVVEKSREAINLPATMLSKDGIKLISVGRLTPVKGFDRLINVISRLRDENIECSLIICGEGASRSKLEKQVLTLGLDNVYFLGFQENPYKFMSQADIYVCSSYSEGYSTSVSESIALGVPVLTTDCSAMNEILCNGEYGDIVSNTEDGLYFGAKNMITNAEYLRFLKTKVVKRSRELLLVNPVQEYIDLFNKL